MKRFFASLILLCLVAALLPVYAEETSLSVDSDGWYIIETAADFYKITNDISGNYRVISDIETTITQPISEFKGIITGWDTELEKAVQRTININLSFTSSTSEDKFGLFKVLSGTAEYLTIKGTLTAQGGNQSYAGGLCGDLQGYAKYIINKVSVTSTGPNAMSGGIAGKISLKTDMNQISNCINEVIITSPYAGGIVGFGNTTRVKITECRNKGTLSGLVTGGIMAFARSVTYIENSFNSGELNGSVSKYGIISYVHNDLINVSAMVLNSYSILGELVPEAAKNVLSKSYKGSEIIQMSETDLETAGWDFDNVWEFDISDTEYVYPKLKWIAAFDNLPPVVANPISDKSMKLGEKIEIEIEGVFSDPDGDTEALSYESSYGTISNGRFTYSPKTIGDNTVKIIAVDIKGGAKAETFIISVGKNENLSVKFKDILNLKSINKSLLSLKSVKLYKGNSELSELSEALAGDTVTIKATIANRTDDIKTATLILVKYKENGVPEKLVTNVSVLPVEENYELSTDFTLSDNEGTISVMLWDSLRFMNAFGSPINIQ